MCERITNQLAALVHNKTTHSLGVYKEVVDNFFHFSIFLHRKMEFLLNQHPDCNQIWDIRGNKFKKTGDQLWMIGNNP